MLQRAHGDAHGRAEGFARHCPWTTLALGWAALAGPLDGCGDHGTDDTARPVVPLMASDPSGPGTYGVGQWETTLQERSAVGGSPRPLPLVVTYPTDHDTADAAPPVAEAHPSGDGPFPVVAFSHGYLGAPGFSTYFVSHLASHGFVVVEPAHADTGDRGVSFDNRPPEVLAAIEHLVEESARTGALLEGAIDAMRVGVAGHSFGGLTTLALLSADPARVVAGVAMAPGIRAGDAFDVRDDIPEIEVPTMFMMGAQDVLARYEDLSPAYRTLPATTERLALVFPRGRHDNYTDACLLSCDDPDALDRGLGHALISTHGTAFLQRYVAGQDAFGHRLEPSPRLGDGEAQLYGGDLP